jgi:hypothetical protein
VQPVLAVHVALREVRQTTATFDVIGVGESPFPREVEGEQSRRTLF